MKVIVAFCLLTAVTVGQLELRDRFVAVEKEGTVSFVVRVSETSPPCNAHGNQTVMASLLVGKKTPCTKDMMPSIPPKMTGPSSNKLIVVRVQISRH